MSLLKAIQKKIGRRELATAPSIITDESGALVRTDIPIKHPRKPPTIAANAEKIAELKQEMADLMESRSHKEEMLRSVRMEPGEFRTCVAELSAVRARIKELRVLLQNGGYNQSSNAIH